MRSKPGHAAILRDRPGDTDAALKYAFELCVGRNPDEVELNKLKDLFREFRSLAAADRDAAAKLAGVPKPADADLIIPPPRGAGTECC